MTPVLDVRGLSVALPAGADRRCAVENATFTLAPGEILCIVGESGSGKSVTAQAIMGLLPAGLSPSGGSVMLEGRQLLGLPEPELRLLRGRRMGMIFQEPMSALNPVMRVGDQVAEVLAAHGMRDQAARERRVLELLANVGLPEPAMLRHAYPFRLSGGQRQRVLIAMALALGPALLIADEPTTALDVTTQAQILALIRQLRADSGLAVLFITHDFGVVAEISDRLLVMREGIVVEEGSTDGILSRPQHPYTQRLLAAVPTGKAPAAVLPAHEQPILLDVRGLRKTYARPGRLFRRRQTFDAVKDVDLTLRRGETLGLVGESGSGKSTVGRCLLRIARPDGGTVLFDGLDLANLSRAALRPFRKRIQVVFQDPYGSLNPRQTAGRMIVDAQRFHGVRPEAARLRAVELLRLVGLEAGSMDRYPHEFSGGQRQRICIARALALDPEILIADEPVSALDVSVQAQVLELLADLRRRLSLAMLFITHDLRVAAQVCDRIAVMRSGEIVETGSTVDLFSDPQHPYTRTLLDAIPGKKRAARFDLAAERLDADS